MNPAPKSPPSGCPRSAMRAPRRLLGGVVLGAVVIALIGCSPASDANTEGSSAKPTAPANSGEAESVFPMPVASGDPGQSLEEACDLLRSGSAIHSERGSAVDLKDTVMLESILASIVDDAQAEFTKVGNPEAAPIATEYSRQVALISTAMLGGEEAITEITEANLGLQAVVGEALALCPTP